ncbi:hypothetical protein [Companilactobacillus mishanensis]|uniref:Uncharacterized protein n=1 Tax=Companilactobacillus mishanensis TaxID=2486008 RepID=A0A5P0ZET6_9LACO|nr:hypothetical protein [Companilactobacillus mishanensis]MQS44338.1 hypothetical protein [Companilactobacillus mishanensis]MQS51560.1 hypothetical protein [Companilactobacillus mishanensis]MQS88578.1 hypothetical protein [Companilactobacillus mishanensis]
MTNKTAILERNVFLERFVTYREVFSEYYKTMSLIDRGEALTYETYSRLTDNFLLNVKNFVKLCESFIEKHNLQNSRIERSLNNYFINLIESLKCMDLDKNTFDKGYLKTAKCKVIKSENSFVKSIGIDLI